MKRTAGLLLALALALNGAAPALAAPDAALTGEDEAAPVLTVLEDRAAVDWTREGRALTVRITEVSEACVLLAAPAVLDGDKNPVYCQTGLDAALYLDQAQPKNGTVTFPLVCPAAWADCALLLLEAGAEPVTLATVDVAPYQTPGFSDVAAGDWFYPAVLAASGLGLVTGYDDGSFRPGETVTAGQYLTLLYRGVGLAFAALPELADAGDDWLAAAAYLNDTLGLEADLTAPLSRYELARLTAGVLTWAQSLRGVTLAIRATHGVADVPADSPYYPAVERLEQWYGVDGYPEADGSYRFRGGESLSRAQACQVLINLLKQAGR